MEWIESKARAGCRTYQADKEVANDSELPSAFAALWQKVAMELEREQSVAAIYCDLFGNGGRLICRPTTILGADYLNGQLFWVELNIPQFCEMWLSEKESVLRKYLNGIWAELLTAFEASSLNGPSRLPVYVHFTSDLPSYGVKPLEKFKPRAGSGKAPGKAAKKKAAIKQAIAGKKKVAKKNKGVKKKK